ncbi:MAG: hypothetical protein HOP16_18975 [Acidobacteria bacterium]|nr:hypothetical protein [Acidobacteriota bacterium]
MQFQDPQFGLRTGYIETRFVRIERANLQPLDLTVPTPASPSTPGQAETGRESGAQSAPSIRFDDDEQAPGRVFLDLNWMRVDPLQEAQAYTFTRTLFGEPATAATAYPELGNAQSVDVNVAVLLGAQLGLGIRPLRIRFDSPVGLAVRIPHPTLTNRFGSDQDATESYRVRSETILDFSAIYSYNQPAWRIAVFGGPTYFRLTQDMVSAINYSQFFNLVGTNTINITTYQHNEVKDSTIGFNAGADASWFFTRHVGVGGGIRFNYGTVQLDEEPLSRVPVDLRVGSTTFVGGARFRF